MSDLKRLADAVRRARLTFEAERAMQPEDEVLVLAVLKELFEMADGLEVPDCDYAGELALRAILEAEQTVSAE